VIIPVFMLLFFQFVLSWNPAFSEEVRVRVLTNRASVEISSSAPTYLINNKTGDSITFAVNRATYSFKPDASGIKMVAFEGDTPPLADFFPCEIIIKPEIAKNKISLNKREYRGALLIKSENFSLDVINILDIEDYIRGTIKYEISPRWPEDAVKAHIVAARTYALFQMRNKKNGDFYLESSVLSQVYGGCSGEDTVADALVDETRGEYIDYEGNIIEGFYHACCGGYTEDVLNVWGIQRSYLHRTRCPFCKESPHYYWEKKFSFNQIQSILKKNGIDLTGIIEIRVKEKSSTDRVLNLEIRHQKGRLHISGTDFRRFLGYNDLPSTLFTIHQRNRGEIIFKGRGWGHGVGMCQWGARGMALLGYNYREILKFYYPGTEIKKLER